MFAIKLLKTIGRPNVFINAHTCPNSFSRSVTQHAGVSEAQKSDEGKTHFGYQTINESEKEEKGMILLSYSNAIK